MALLVELEKSGDVGFRERKRTRDVWEGDEGEVGVLIVAVEPETVHDGGEESGGGEKGESRDFEVGGKALSPAKEEIRDDGVGRGGMGCRPAHDETAEGGKSV